MSRSLRVSWALVLGLCLVPGDAFGRRYYPRGYGRYGWGGWGMGATDPAAGYMAGLGAFARGQGVYEVEDAKAQAINQQTMIKWNQELRARQQALRQEKAQQGAERVAERDARVTRLELEDGTTLNNLLGQILDFDPAATRSTQAGAPLGASAVREIPFQWDSEAITLCLDQLTVRDGLPEGLKREEFAAERAELGKAVAAALDEDRKGDVSPRTMKRLNAAIAAWRAKFARVVTQFDPDRDDGDAYFSTMASLARLLHDPSMKKVLAELENLREIRVGDLLAFMQAYNLRFGPATTGRQVQIYETLVGLLQQVKNDLSAAAAPPGVPPPPAPGVVNAAGKGLQDAARAAFGNIGWPQLEAHEKAP